MKRTNQVFMILGQILILGMTLAAGDMMVGGLSDERVPSENDPLQKEIIPRITTEIRSQVSSRLSSSSGGSENGSNPLQDAPITVLSYKTQVVAGTNYFVKAKIGKFIFHLRIYEDLQGATELTSVKGPKTESDPIEYF